MGCSNEKTLQNYMIPDPFSKPVEGETIVHVNSQYSQVAQNIAEIENATAISSIQKAFLSFSNLPCLGFRKQKNDKEVAPAFTFLTYDEIKGLSINLSKNLKINQLVDEITYEDQKGNFKIFGIFARNCVEWIVNDIALQMDDITSVTFYSTLGAESFDHIFKQTGIKTIAVSPESIKKLCEFHEKFKFSTLTNVIVYDYTLYINKEVETEQLKKLGVNIFFFSDLIKAPTENVTLTPARPDSILTLCYTSGTTSLPKGAMLTQRGLATQKNLLSDTGIVYNTNDTQISYLPLAHVMERANIIASLASGSRVGFLSTLDVKKSLMEDIEILKPTILIAVPRILINFHQKVMDTFSKLKGLSKTLADKAMAAKRANYIDNHEIRHSTYDWLIFKKVRAKFGGKIRALVSGSAPVPKDISMDIKLMLSVPLVEGYGMTELSGGSNGTSIFDCSNSNVGAPLRTLYLKLVDKKELNYHSGTEFEGKHAPTGEICYKGPSVFAGYFRDSENTRQTIDEDGWLHTGDVGMIDPTNKGLKIVDRVKEIFKLSQGEYIAPAKLEGAYNKSPFVGQICIYGNSEKSNIVAIVVVNKAKCAEVLRQEGKINEGDQINESHLTEPKLIEAISKNFDEIAKFSKFNSLEKPFKYILTFQEFTVQNDLLTPTMKLVRKKIQNFFQEQINKAYE